MLAVSEAGYPTLHMLTTRMVIDLSDLTYEKGLRRLNLFPSRDTGLFDDLIHVYQIQKRSVDQELVGGFKCNFQEISIRPKHRRGHLLESSAQGVRFTSWIQIYSAIKVTDEIAGKPPWLLQHNHANNFT